MKQMLRAVVAVAVVGLSFACGDDSNDLDTPAPSLSGGENGPVAGSSPAYPGARDSHMSETRGMREMYFRTEDSIARVFAHFDEALRSDGWNVLDQKTGRAMMEGWYLSGRQSLRLEVLREDGDLYRVRMQTTEVGAASDDGLAQESARPIR